MQPSSAMRSLLFCVCLIASAQGATFLRSSFRDNVVRVGATAHTSTYRAEWVALLQVETDDRQFWADEWGAMETELLQLQRIALGNASSANSSKLAHIANAVVAVSKLVAVNTSAAGKLDTVKNASVATNASVQHVSAKEAAREERHRNILKGIKLNLNPKSPMDLLPALAMLKGMYEDGKDRIAKLNVREKQSKEHFTEKVSHHSAKLEEIEARFKNHSLNAEFRTNETRDENRIWSYWQRVRERQHRQFHTSLKIQHGTLQKVKMMIDMYEKTISGTADKAQMKKELAQASGGLPEVVFFQEAQKATVQFCNEALAEVQEGRQELHNDPTDHTLLLQTS